MDIYKYLLDANRLKLDTSKSERQELQTKAISCCDKLSCYVELSMKLNLIGSDTVFALAVLELKEEGYDIKLHCAIPCKNHSCKWIRESVDLYNDILSKADTVKLVSDEEYKPWLMQKRNEYMVDLADKIIAVWDGSKGGTGNCVRYAEKCSKKIIRIMP